MVACTDIVVVRKDIISINSITMMMVVARCRGDIAPGFGLGFGALCFGWMGEHVHILRVGIHAGYN